MHATKRFLAVMLVAVISGDALARPAPAEDGQADPIKAALDGAKAAHTQAVNNASKDLLAAFDDKIKSVSKTGNLNAVKQLMAEREAFESAGKLPSSNVMQAAVAKYWQATKQPDDALVSAYETAVREYTRKMLIDRAEAVQNQMKEFLAGRKAGTAFDPILARLNEAKKQHRTRLQEAKEDLLLELDQMIRAAADRGDLDGVKALRAARKQFQTDGTLPELKEPAVKGAKIRYERAVKVAAAVLKAAYERTIRDYKRQKQFDRAKEVEQEMKKSLPFGLPGEWIDVLKLIDPKKHAVSGKWEKVKTGLRGYKQAAACRIMIPIVPEGNYELQASFTRRRGNGAIIFMLPIGKKEVVFALNSYSSRGGFNGMSMIDGKTVYNSGKGNPTTLRGKKLTNGRVHRVAVRVEVSGEVAKVEADLDGKRLVKWSGKQTRFSMPPPWKLPDNRLFGSGMWDSEVDFHEMKLRMLTGKAVPWEESPAKQDRRGHAPITHRQEEKTLTRQIQTPLGAKSLS